MTDYSAEELLWERQMQDDGAARYWARSAESRETGIVGTTPPGRALIRRYVRQVELGIKAFLKAAGRRPARNALGARRLREVRPGVAALLTTACVVDRVHEPRKVRTLALQIGGHLEDEARFRAVRKASPGLWKDLRRATRHKKPAARRRHSLRVAAAEGLLPDRWTQRERAAAGAACLEALDARTDLLRFETVWVGPKRRSVLAFPTDELLRWLEEADARTALASPLYRPTIEPPARWEGVEGGGYHTDLVLRRPIARFRGRAHKALVEGTDPRQYAEVLRSLNRLQEVPWRANEDVLVALEHLFEGGLAPLDELVELPVPPRPVVDELDGGDPEEWEVWRRTARRTLEANRERQGRRILVRHTAAAAREVVGRTVYMPHRLDFRGRAYPTPSWLHPQGPDAARALLRFAAPDVMTPDGWAALAAWGREVTGRPCGLDEPATLDAARAVYADPLEHSALWAGADKPFQALAWYFEVGAALEAGYPERPFLTSLPIYVDASNNGLQLYALMTGARDLARRTNALPGPKHDLYTEVAGLAWRSVLKDAEDPAAREVKRSRSGRRTTSDGEIAANWRAILPGGVPRNELAKRPVMTRAYTVTLWSAADYVRQGYEELYTTPADRGPIREDVIAHHRYLARALLRAVDEACPEAVAAMDWIKGVAALAAGRGVPLRWTAPNGWPVLQDYRERREAPVRALLGGSVKKVTLYEETGRADPDRQVSGAPPNFVHSVDQAVMTRAVTSFEGPIATVHDAFATTAPRIRELGVCLRAAVADVAVTGDPLRALRDEVEEYLGVEVPPPPRFGEIVPEEVMAAENLFT